MEGPASIRVAFDLGETLSGSTREQISFRQVHKATGARVRHRRCAELTGNEAAQRVAAEASTGAVEPLPIRASLNGTPAALSPSELAKGYEYEKDQYVCLSREELTQLLR